MKPNRFTLWIPGILMFLVGLTVWMIPFFTREVTAQRMQMQVRSFLTHSQNGRNELDDPDRKVPDEGNPVETTSAENMEPQREYADLWGKMVSYNETIWQEKQEGLCDPWTYQQPSFVLGDYGTQTEIFGVIVIPKLELELPLYLGATDQHLAEGAAHLSQTSIPIGGSNTNCVIAGHRGWKGADYFRYITELSPGDEVIVVNLWETLTYTVTSTQIVAPNDINSIHIQADRDMLTLLTCHPYASGGQQRYLVYCDRVITEEGGMHGTT